MSVNLTLRGPQDTSVAAHLSQTVGAAIGLRVGGALIWMNDRQTVSTFGQVWRRAQHDSLLLPRHSPSGVAPVSAPREPTVMVEESGSPAAWARLLRPEGQPGFLWVLLGGLTFDVRDLPAFRSTLLAFRRATEIADEVFLPDRREMRSRWSARVANRAFISPADSPYQQSVRDRLLPSAAQRDPALPRVHRGEQTP